MVPKTLSFKRVRIKSITSSDRISTVKKENKMLCFLFIIIAVFVARKYKYVRYLSTFPICYLMKHIC